MAQDITAKQAAFVSRAQSFINQIWADCNALIALQAEWTASGYAIGAPEIDGTSWVIPDAQVQAAVSAATAAQLNTAMGALNAIVTTFQQQQGYLVPFKS